MRSKMFDARTSIPQLDFSRDVLEPAGKDLWVHRVPPCGWTDLGTPKRLDEHRGVDRSPFGGPVRAAVSRVRGSP